MGIAAILLCALALAAPAEQAPSAEREVDRLVAVVDEDPIFLSDIERALALGTLGDLERTEAEDPRRLRRRVLDRLVEQRLRSHEVDRYGSPSVPEAAIEAQLRSIADRFGGDEALGRRLAEVDLAAADLRSLVRRQLAVLAYVEERLAPRVFVEEADVRAYYDGELAAELARRGIDRPPLDEVREPIEALLRERALERETERWTDELRRQASVVDLLDSDPLAGDPPVVWRSGG